MIGHIKWHLHKVLALLFSSRLCQVLANSKTIRERGLALSVEFQGLCEPLHFFVSENVQIY